MCIRDRIGRLEKAAEELRPWGAFDVEATRKLAARGIVLRYFFTQRNTFDKQLACLLYTSVLRRAWSSSSIFRL